MQHQGESGVPRASIRPYDGRTRKLVLAFDVGTTYSGIGYAILDPGQAPTIQCVTRYPGQENGDFKIPSIIWYKPDGTVRAAGAEARDPALEMAVEDEGLIFVEWFKLHLRPQSLSGQLGEYGLQPLPLGKTVIDVFADFLKYLFACAKTYIIESHPNGQSLWSSIESNIHVVLSHPNGWEGLQQEKMRQAAVQAGIIPDSLVDQTQVSFVTEGEASIQYCVSLGMASGFIKEGSTVMLVDAGGGTVDLSTYCFTSTSPVTLEEIAPIGCILQGSTRVNVRAAQFLRSKLAESKYGYYDEVKNMVDSFEKYTKPTFKDSNDKAFIKFGSMRDRDPEFGIRNGQLILEGTAVEALFEPSVQGIIQSIREQQQSASQPVSMVFLVGGFAASPWLFHRLTSTFQPLGINISRPDNHTNKAVAEGAISFYLERFVTARIAKLTYGVRISQLYDSSNPEHQARPKYTTASGDVRLPGFFKTIVTKGARFTEETELREPLVFTEGDPSKLNTVWVEFMCYRGSNTNVQWIDAEADKFTTLCKFTGDTSKVRKVPVLGLHGDYYRQSYELVVFAGRTEMRAQLAWQDDGIEKRGSTQIIYYEG